MADPRKKVNTGIWVFLLGTVIALIGFNRLGHGLSFAWGPIIVGVLIIFAITLYSILTSQ